MDKSEYIKNILKDPRLQDNICKAICDGDRIEIVPSKDGAKVLRVKKHELNKYLP